MIFKITKIEMLTSAKGTSFARATVQNEHNQEFSNVTLFSPASNKTVGETLTGELTANDYNGKVGWKFKEETTGTYNKRPAANIGAAMDKKAANIEVAQDRKNDAIKLAAHQRDAVLIVTTFYADAYKLHTPGEMEASIKAQILSWKNWLEMNYGDNKPF